jgi:hypothetical protein
MDTKRQYRKLPYCNSNFEKIRTEGYAYVDKTRFIELLEQEANDKLFFTRPRKFGKSLFFNMLYHYYDICRADAFETLFGDLYIGQHPTPKKNQLLVLQFNFSGIDTSSQESFVTSFRGKLRMNLSAFAYEHKTVLSDFEKIIDRIAVATAVSELVSIPFDIARSLDRKLFIIIDEYDHFANDFIATGTSAGVDFYKTNIRANGMVRDFYETLKEGGEKIIDRIMLAGVTPIMLDDLTSGFNVSSNISLKQQYNEILGFTQDELEWLMTETGIDPSRIPVDIKTLYDGYKFHFKGKHTIYNPSMMLFILNELLETDYHPEHLLDENITIDYGRLRTLFASPQNRKQLMEIVLNNRVIANVVQRFPVDEIHQNANFISLLFYMGLLTVDEHKPATLKIPNSSVSVSFWNYMERIVTEQDNIFIDNSEQETAMYQLAYESDPKPFLDCMSKSLISQMSNRDLINFNEKYIKVMLLSRLMQTSFFTVISEPELATGYADIWLERAANHPEIEHEWIWELKYVPKSNDEQAIAARFAEAETQLKKYRASSRLANRPNTRYLATVFIGKDEYRMREITE